MEGFERVDGEGVGVVDDEVPYGAVYEVGEGAQKVAFAGGAGLAESDGADGVEEVLAHVVQVVGGVGRGGVDPCGVVVAAGGVAEMVGEVDELVCAGEGGDESTSR